jgi:hypothetical protein
VRPRSPCRLVSIALALAAASCAARYPSVRFQGETRAPVATIEQLRRVPELPRGADKLGTLEVSCRRDASFEPFDERSLADIDCSEGRLIRMLSEVASASGGDTLVELHCYGLTILSCQAVLARQAPDSAPRVAGPAPDVFGQLGAEISVSFSPNAPSPGRASRAVDSVRDLPALPPSHRVVGSLEARCASQCSEALLRDGLRVAAGRLGVDDVVGVRCFGWEDGTRCFGSGAIAEREDGS